MPGASSAGPTTIPTAVPTAVLTTAVPTIITGPTFVAPTAVAGHEECNIGNYNNDEQTLVLAYIA